MDSPGRERPSDPPRGQARQEDDDWRLASAVTGVSEEPFEGLQAEAAAQRAHAGRVRRAEGRRIARNTAIFSVATGLSRIAGLVREIVASSYFATSGAFSAFTLAFQVPNLVRSLFADAALQAAFVPVFTELLEHGRRRDAFRLASTLFLLILAALGALAALFILTAGWIMPLFTGTHFNGALDHLTVGLSRVLFPIVVLLGLNGLVVGILNAYDHFSIPAIAPLVWNVVIIVLLVALRPLFGGSDQLYAYAIGVLVATVVQFAMAVPVLGRIDFRLRIAFDWRDERVRRVLGLMLPVTLGLGVINFDLLINSTQGTLVSDQAPRAIDAAFRIYMLPQGMFSVALATVLFPALSRLAARRDYLGLGATMSNGVRQIFLLLVPAAAFTLALATPIVRLIYQHGSFHGHSTDQVSLALFWFSFSLPFAGANLLLTRTFFSLQRPWIPTALASGSIVVDAAIGFALYKPVGLAGPVIGTVVSNAAMTAAQVLYLRRLLGRGLQGRRTLVAVVQIVLAAALMGGVAWGVWRSLDEVLGATLVAQIISVGVAALAALLVYAGTVLLIRMPEALQIRALVLRRLGRAPA
ncbi:MAG: murein biosynthesis integral membrane protein MurJ [Actinobacteria bacterium]|nr:MAG: murein biosynthesis integral membrane protein MurJ [Actinomycetota bacterium]